MSPDFYGLDVWTACRKVRVGAILEIGKRRNFNVTLGGLFFILCVVENSSQVVRSWRLLDSLVWLPGNNILFRPQGKTYHWLTSAGWYPGEEKRRRFVRISMHFKTVSIFTNTHIYTSHYLLQVELRNYDVYLKGIMLSPSPSKDSISCRARATDSDHCRRTGTGHCTTPTCKYCRIELLLVVSFSPARTESVTCHFQC